MPQQVVVMRVVFADVDPLAHGVRGGRGGGGRDQRQRAQPRGDARRTSARLPGGQGLCHQGELHTHTHTQPPPVKPIKTKTLLLVGPSN